MDPLGLVLVAPRIFSICGAASSAIGLSTAKYVIEEANFSVRGCLCFQAS